MPLRILWRQLLVAAVGLCVLNVGIARLARNSVPRQVLRQASRTSGTTDLFLGNSLVQAGFVPSVFQERRPERVAVNLGVGATSPVEHLLMYAASDPGTARGVYYGFFDDQLTRVTEGRWTTLVGNRALSYYVRPDIAERLYAADSLWHRAAFRAVSVVPMLVERQSLWAWVERIRRGLGGIGMPRVETNQFGRVADFSLLEQDARAFEDHCRQAVAAATPLTPAVVEMARRARAGGAQFVAIEMPMPSAHRRLYYQSEAWRAYRAMVESALRSEGALYVAAADWIGDDGFSDALHLSPDGAVRFTRSLADWSARALPSVPARP